MRNEAFFAYSSRSESPIRILPVARAGNPEPKERWVITIELEVATRKWGKVTLRITFHLFT